MTTNRNILLIDDEPTILKNLKRQFEKERYAVATAKTAQEGLDQARRTKPDIIILDLMLPDMSGFDVYRQIKDEPETSSIPILMLTGRADNTSQVVGLELGADDYVTKPYDFGVLHARVKKLFRQQHAEPAQTRRILKAGDITADLDSQRIYVNGEETIFTTLEFRLVCYMMQHRGQVLTREQMINGTWNENVAVVDRAVDVHINAIRKKLNNSADYIETVRGTGYRFRDAD